MSNIIKFQRRPKPRPPRQTPPWPRSLLIVLGIAATLLIIWTYFYLTTPAQAGAYSRCGVVRQHCVVDGDTLYVGGQKIRVADIDTPEVSDPKCESEKALGERATLRLIELVNQGAFEMLAWQGRDEDQYGRKLRVLVRGGRSIGDILVSEGLARTWTGRREPWC